MDNIQANPVGINYKDIYIIKNDINNKVYIGQSLDAEQRFKSHCKGNYDNSLIDAAIQKYDKSHFYYEILEKQILNYNEREKYWISYYNSITPNGYNILQGGNTPPVYYGENHPNAKLTQIDVNKIKDYLKNTQFSLNEIAKEFNVSKRQIGRINCGVSWTQPNEHYPIRKIPNSNGKLEAEQIDLIIDLLKYSYQFNGEIARQFGVEVHTISDINNGYSHKKNNIEYPIRKWKSSGKFPLTYEQVSEIIFKLKNTKESLRSIARFYTVTHGVIQNINNGSIKYRRENLQYPLRPYN